jgi:hypothetical protein
MVKNRGLSLTMVVLVLLVILLMLLQSAVSVITLTVIAGSAILSSVEVLERCFRLDWHGCRSVSI